MVVWSRVRGGTDLAGKAVWIIGPPPLKSTHLKPGKVAGKRVDTPLQLTSDDTGSDESADTRGDYRVEIDVYNGPMDLLLYLIKRDELDIYDIPIAQITDSYIAYVKLLRELRDGGGLDINLAGEFLVMAATLMEIKSATMLPKAPVEEGRDGGTRSAADELADPRAELVQKLLEYKRFKDTSMLLERRAAEHAVRFPRYPAKLAGQDADEPPPVDLEEVQIWDLLSVFERLMKEVGPRRSRFHEVTYDDTPIDLHAADIEDRLKREGHITLRQLILGRKSRSEMIGVFLALLELIREKKILVTQADDDLSDVSIDPAPEEHRKTYEHASLHLSDEAARPPAPVVAPSETAAPGEEEDERGDD
jgi:segregation and condensation protein A